MRDRTESYRDPCPKCGARLLGVSKPEYIAHLRENGETLAAKIEEELVVPESATKQNGDSASKQSGPYDTGTAQSNASDEGSNE